MAILAKKDDDSNKKCMKFIMVLGEKSASVLLKLNEIKLNSDQNWSWQLNLLFKSINSNLPLEGDI